MAASGSSSASAKSVDSVISDAADWLTDEERALAETLLSADQSHLFSKWSAGSDEDKKHAFFEVVSAASRPSRRLRVRMLTLFSASMAGRRG